MSYYNQGPPPGQGYPPPQHSPYPPQQGGYPPPQQGYGQQPPQMNQGYYGQQPPQQQWNQPPPHQGGYGPPQGGSPYPPGPSPYGAPPPGPPPGHYNQGPPPQHMGGYGSPAPQQQWGAPPPGPPPQQHYGGGPPQGGYAQPDPPSMGYVPGQQAQMDMTRAADDLRAAMKGLGTDENRLINTLKSLDPLQINGVKAAFQAKHRRDLMKDIHGETSGYFREGLEAIIRGPLDQDCHVLDKALNRIGTKESALNEVLLLRSNADLNAIKQRYQQMFRRSLESDVKGDLSMKTERLFAMVLEANRPPESTPVQPHDVDRDVQEIYRCTEGKMGTDQFPVCSILTHRSRGQIRAIAQAYKAKYHRSLPTVIKSEFSGHMQEALLYIVHGGEDPAKHDADLLEEAMAGAGTKDVALVRRIVAIHWDRNRLQQCKAAYRHFYKRELASRIKGETSGDYERLMVACIGER